VTNHLLDDIPVDPMHRVHTGSVIVAAAVVGASIERLLHAFGFGRSSLVVADRRRSGHVLDRMWSQIRAWAGIEKVDADAMAGHNPQCRKSGSKKLVNHPAPAQEIQVRSGLPDFRWNR
jgi:hypothetical protein